MNGIGDFLPRRDLGIAINSRYIGMAACLERDECGFYDKKGTGELNRAGSNIRPQKGADRDRRQRENASEVP